MQACPECHNRYAAIKDSIGYVPGVGVDGLPVDDGHWWSKG